MKILHIIDSGGLYGAEVMLLNLMSEQVRLGLEPILASLGEKNIEDKPIEVEAGRRGLRVKKFRMSAGPNIFGASDIMRFAREETVDLLHSHGYKGNILIGFIPKAIRRTPMVSTVHGWTWTGGMSRMMVYEWLDSLSLAHMDRVILVNAAMKEHRRLKNNSRISLEVIPNGIPVDAVKDNGGDEAKIDPDIQNFCRQGFTVGAIGRFSPEKGFVMLLEVVAGLIAEGKDIRLVLLGEGNLRNELETRARAFGIEKRVLMPGYVRNARNYLPLFDLFAMPSLTEGLPIVLLEAMQADVPIVATRVGGIPDVLHEGRCGLLIKSECSEALERGITNVMQHPEAAEERVKAAKQRVIENYSSRTMAERYLEIYKNVLR